MSLTYTIITVCVKLIILRLIQKFNIFNLFKKQMRVFDTLTTGTKDEIINNSIAFAKREIADNNLTGYDVKLLALDYVWQFGIIIEDYNQHDPLIIAAWGGPMPVKIPR